MPKGGEGWWKVGGERRGEEKEEKEVRTDSAALSESNEEGEHLVYLS